MLTVSLDRDTAVILIAQARQLPVADVEALDDRDLEAQFQSVDIRRMLARLTDAPAKEPAPHALPPNGNGLDVQLSPLEARVVADELLLAGDTLVRKALDQLDRGAVFDELMDAANRLLQRGNRLSLAAAQAENG
ncbi:hypothetical protein [Mycobacterium sp. 1245852.3]|uniref:hypothetical protein n=1 Tax=Mycobacterium sp. 1245852.3 TaxID=1856860 RepID=UPI0007FDD110|nr:hypothetical protein [Mycobacterium sp. 1245852.3]OBJ81090.1 hypothetical protein A9W96_29540 [Mycobacterium sp. 1245852.3]